MLSIRSAAAQDLHVGRSLSCVLEEGGLAHTASPRMTSTPASRPACILEERAEPERAGVPAVQHPRLPQSIRGDGSAVAGSQPANSPVRMPTMDSHP